MPEPWVVLSGAGDTIMPMDWLTKIILFETQLRKVIPLLCVNDVLERVAEVKMSSSNPVRCDPMPDWLQPSDKNWLMGKNREVIGWKYTRKYRTTTKKERKLLHKEKELDHYLNPGFPVDRRFRNTN